jgi:alpha-1,3-glucosyltransferase
VAARHRDLLRLVAHVTLCAFMFGWHVHEKAALMVTVPLALALASEASGGASSSSSAFAGGEYLFLSTVAHYAITPLLFQPREWPIKILAVVLGAAVTRGALRRVLAVPSGGGTHGGVHHGKTVSGDKQPLRLLGRVQWCYLAVGLPCVEAYAAAGHCALFGPGRMEFLPLMATSVYCAAGVAWAWGVQAAGALGADTSRAYSWP